MVERVRDKQRRRTGSDSAGSRLAERESPAPSDAPAHSPGVRSKPGAGGRIREAESPAPSDAPAHSLGVRSKPGAGGRLAERESPAPNKKVIALVYDFDGTLSPKPMQEYAFLPKLGIDPKSFWAECTRAGDSGITVKHYLISSGLTEIIEGTKIYPHFANVFASEYWFDAYDLPFPKRVISDTGKTQFLFRINKGLEDLSQSINAHMPEAQRPIPFSNFIYFGDGDTDVPSMALLKKNGGQAIAVHGPDESEAKCVELFKAGRCDFYAVADYRKGSDLWKRTCLLLDRIIADVRVREEVRGLGAAP